MKVKIPDRLETDRLVLRRFSEPDWRDLYAYYSDTECMKYTIGRPLSKGETWRAMASMLGHWQLRGYGPYAIEAKATNRILGPVGLWYPQDWPEPEIKWGLARSFWGQGYASEAGRAVRDMARVAMPDVQLISLIHPENSASIHVALALGATLERVIDFRGGEANIYRHRA
jgi:RimJ/RimL family protein N-acetyltransferase